MQFYQKLSYDYSRNQLTNQKHDCLIGLACFATSSPISHANVKMMKPQIVKSQKKSRADKMKINTHDIVIINNRLPK